MTEPHEEAFSMCCRIRESILKPSNFFTICEIMAQNTLYGTNGKTEGVVFQKLDLVSPPAHPLQTNWGHDSPTLTHSVSPRGKRACRHGTIYPHLLVWTELHLDVYSFPSDWTMTVSLCLLRMRNPELCCMYTSFSTRMYIMVTLLLLNISQSLTQCYLYYMTIRLERG